jgi:hypothetical protein
MPETGTSIPTLGSKVPAVNSNCLIPLTRLRRILQVQQAKFFPFDGSRIPFCEFAAGAIINQ